jgi:polar amino acid transport system substrate-binding protein
MQVTGHRFCFVVMLTIAAATTAGFGGQVATAQDRTIRIAVEGKFPPFNYLDSNGDLQGFDVEIAKALCDAMQSPCELVVNVWEDMIPGLLDNRYDAIVSSMSMSVERREKVAFTARYYDSPTTFITNTTSPLQTFAPQDLAGKRLGVTLATAQEAYAQHFYADASIVVFAESPELYQGLADGKVDVILEDKLAAYDWLTNTKAGGCCEFRGDDIKDPTYFGDGAGIALRKEDVTLLSDFNEALDGIADDGTYNMINAKYFPFPIR